MRKPTIVAAVLAVAALLAVAPGASAQDSLAPKGALPHWIPNDDWVYEHWLPYDETRLYAVLGIDRGQMWRHLRDDAVHDLRFAHVIRHGPGNITTLSEGTPRRANSGPVECSRPPMPPP